MRKTALEYFKTQPSFGLMVAPKVRGEVLKMWLDGYELAEVQEKLLNTELMIDCVVRCKEYVANIAGDGFDVDSDENTKDFCRGFFDYIAELYNEIENKYMKKV